MGGWVDGWMGWGSYRIEVEVLVFCVYLLGGCVDGVDGLKVFGKCRYFWLVL